MDEASLNNLGMPSKTSRVPRLWELDLGLSKAAQDLLERSLIDRLAATCEIEAHLNTLHAGAEGVPKLEEDNAERVHCDNSLVRVI